MPILLPNRVRSVDFIDSEIDLIKYFVTSHGSAWPHDWKISAADRGRGIRDRARSLTARTARSRTLRGSPARTATLQTDLRRRMPASTSPQADGEVFGVTTPPQEPVNRIGSLLPFAEVSRDDASASTSELLPRGRALRDHVNDGSVNSEPEGDVCDDRKRAVFVAERSRSKTPTACSRHARTNRGARTRPRGRGPAIRAGGLRHNPARASPLQGREQPRSDRLSERIGWRLIPGLSANSFVPAA